MKNKEKRYTVGVIVARFQVAELHEAHKELIDYVIDRHAKTIIFLGLSHLKGTINNPLDYRPRRQMLLEAYPPAKYPNLDIAYIRDVNDNALWSKQLDDNISHLTDVNDTVLLYGGRDSFITSYEGGLDTQELESAQYLSGSEIRKLIGEAPKANKDFRAGAIWATFQRYPSICPTVDVAVIDKGENRLLLARKENERYYRFVGGFVSPDDDSFEAAARRELYEETFLTATLERVGSFKIDDWRYRAETDKIITTFYIGWYLHGAARANDDIAQVKWWDIDYILEDINIKMYIAPEHYGLAVELRKVLEIKKIADISNAKIAEDLQLK